MQVTIWHNPRCSKSRTTLQLLEDNGVTPDVVLYLDTPPSKTELASTLKLLGMRPRDILRKGAASYKNNGLADASLSDDQIIEIMTKNPILIERPIVTINGKATIGRPPENILKFL